jgi:hypothetical protein
MSIVGKGWKGMERDGNGWKGMERDGNLGKSGVNQRNNAGECRHLKLPGQRVSATQSVQS